LKPVDPNMFVPRVSCETSLPPDVIAGFLNVSFPWLCDSLARHDDAEYVKRTLSEQLLAYFDPSDFRGKRRRGPATTGPRFRKNTRQNTGLFFSPNK
jgi:hypothetical protein